jgi:hypothetical protein
VAELWPCTLPIPVANTGDPGTYTLGPVSFGAGGGITYFQAQGGDSFSYSGTLDGEPADLSGSFEWAYFVNSSSPTLVGQFLSLSGTIDGVFASSNIGAISLNTDNLGEPLTTLVRNSDSRTVGISGGTISVPGPELGAGLPGMLSACAALWYLTRRKRLHPSDFTRARNFAK